MDIVARLAPSATPAQADAALATAAPDASAATIPLRRQMIGAKQRDMALFVLAAAALVLLLTCANLADCWPPQIGARKYRRWRFVRPSGPIDGGWCS